jgi:hypothetical protein
MTGAPLILAVAGALLVGAAGLVVWWAPRRDGYALTRASEHSGPVLRAALRRTPGPAAAPGRVYVITDLHRTAPQTARPGVLTTRSAPGRASTPYR